jgi:TIGR03009 family protein
MQMLRFSKVCGSLLLVASFAFNAFSQQSGTATQASNATSPQGTPIQILSPEQAVQAGVARVAEAPFPALTPEQQQYLDQVLNVWQQRTADIKQYQCNFTRWQFDPTIDPSSPAIIDQGILKYASPDKGLFRIDNRQSIAKKGPQPEYRASGKFGEYWICDGEYVHILARNDKKATKIQLPPQMRGQAIYLSPLPFLFGVNAAEIKQRYWIRPVKPPQGDDVWLEAFPKRTDDAGNYSRVQVVLDPNEVLPKALIVFLPNWRANQPHREHYEFTDRQPNLNFLDAIKQNFFMKEFIDTKLPSDWQVIVEPYLEPQDAVPPGQGSPNPTQQRVAQPPPQAKVR